MVRLGDVCKIIGGYAFKSEEFITDGVPVIRISNLDGETVNVDKNVCYSVEFLKNNDNFIVRKNDILMAMSGATVGKIGVYPNEYVALLNQRVCNLKPVEDKLNREYLNCYCQSDYFKSEILKNAFGCAQPNISVKQIADFEIKILDLKSQVRIANKLKNILCLIEKRKQQLQKLDELVKARFVEMFGDPILNPHGYERVALSELADIKIGPFGSLLHKEDYTENGHPLVNPSHIIEGKVLPDNKLTVSSEKYDELSAYHLKVGDVVMGRRGEMGRCAVVDCDGYLCGTGSLLIRTKGEVTADYIQKSISFPSFKKSIEDMAVGQTMSNLNVPIVSKLQLIKPPIEVQNDYYEFVAKIDKSKLSVQNSLDRLEILKKALMQKYFG